MSGAQCEEFRELVSASLDERLEGAELLRLAGHLEACPECRAFEGELRRFGELLQAAEAIRPLRRPPPGFAAGVVSRAVAQQSARAVPLPPPASRRPFPLSWAGLAAAAAAALLLAWSWQRLLPLADQEPRWASRPAALVAAAADEGSMASWMHQHAAVSRDGTILGPAEEIEFAGFHSSGVVER